VQKPSITKASPIEMNSSDKTSIREPIQSTMHNKVEKQSFMNRMETSFVKNKGSHQINHILN
jgi:hypothetical protein